MGNGLIRIVGGVALGVIVGAGAIKVSAPAINGTINYAKAQFKPDEVMQTQIQMIKKSGNAQAAERLTNLENRYDISAKGYKQLVSDVFMASSPKEATALIDSAVNELNTTPHIVKMGKTLLGMR
jgi:hypothetical protein